jgi:hypothetical protein
MNSTHPSINSGERKKDPTKEQIRSSSEAANSMAAAQISRGRARLFGLLFVVGLSLVVWLFVAEVLFK